MDDIVQEIKRDKEEDVETYLRKVIDVYRTTFDASTEEADKDDDFLGIEGRNLLDFIKSREGLSNKERNELL